MNGTSVITGTGQAEKAEKATPLLFDGKKIWQFLAPKILNLVNISLILTVAGFFVIQSYLASFSKFFTFNINITQYVIAGTNLSLAIAWNLVLPVFLYGFIFAVGLAVVFLLGRWCISQSKRVHEFYESLLKHVLPLFQRLRSIIRVLWSVYQVVAGALFILLFILTGFVYGTFYYAQSPRMFGGGMPADVILVFKEDQPTQSNLWPFPINPTSPRESEQVELLVELTDGIVVRDPTTKVAVIVKNDVLQGIIDAIPPTNHAVSPLITPTQPIATPTP